MDNKEHRERILKLLAEAWDLVPGWRLGQLLSNLLGNGPQDVFHPSNTAWEMMLDDFIAAESAEEK